MGTLKALVGGSWVPILGGGGVNEVAVSPDVPTDPNVELWYDTDDPGYGLPYATAWTALTFQNGWANKGGSEQPCQYRKVGDIVYLRGCMTKTAVTYGPAAWTLPVGFRPLYLTRISPLVMNAAGTQSLARVDIQTDGTYLPQAGPTDAGWWTIDYQFSVTA